MWVVLDEGLRLFVASAGRIESELGWVDNLQPFCVESKRLTCSSPTGELMLGTREPIWHRVSQACWVDARARHLSWKLRPPA